MHTITNHEDLCKANQLKPIYSAFILDSLSDSKTILTINLTFNDRYKTSVRQAKKDAIHFKNLLNHNIYGKYKGKLKNQTKGCLVVEGDDYNPLLQKTHIHGILGFDLDSVNLCKAYVRRHWAELKRAGVIDLLDEWDGNDKWINYILKSASKSEMYSDSLIF